MRDCLRMGGLSWGSGETVCRGDEAYSHALLRQFGRRCGSWAVGHESHELLDGGGGGKKECEAFVGGSMLTNITKT